MKKRRSGKRIVNYSSCELYFKAAERRDFLQNMNSNKTQKQNDERKKCVRVGMLLHVTSSFIYFY